MEETGEGIAFRKFTPSQLRKWRTLDGVLYGRALATTGIRLDFHTDSEFMELACAGGGKFEIWVDGLPRYAFDADETPVFRAPLSLPFTGRERDCRVTVYFPAHDHAGMLKQLSLDDGAYVRAHRFDRKILFMGDSITQGWAAEHDSLSYANRVSRAFNAESVVQGVGGSCFCPEIPEPLSFDPDWVIVAYGTNDFTACTDVGKFRETLDAYLSGLKALYPQKAIFVISPIWREKIGSKCGLVFAGWRQLIADTAERYGFVPVDGARLVPPVRDFYHDSLHPNDSGFAFYAENLTEFLKKYEKIPER